MRFLMTLLFGLLPEVLYFTLFITFTKNIKEKRIKLFCLISIVYVLCIVVQKWQILYYLFLIFGIYICLKISYKQKVQIIDMFIVSTSYFWIVLLSFLLIFLVKKDMSNYMFIYYIERALLFVPFIFKSKFNKVYKKYCKLWNRNDNEKRKIKSITLRNISLILLNSFIFFINLAIINISNFPK